MYTVKKNSVLQQLDNLLILEFWKRFTIRFHLLILVNVLTNMN